MTGRENYNIKVSHQTVLDFGLCTVYFGDALGTLASQFRPKGVNAANRIYRGGIATQYAPLSST